MVSARAFLDSKKDKSIGFCSSVYREGNRYRYCQAKMGDKLGVGINILIRVENGHVFLPAWRCALALTRYEVV